MVSVFQVQLEPICKKYMLGVSKLTLCLIEALSNALIHGNLEISSKIKEEDFGKFNQLKKEVYHLGIENTDVFLFKTRQALDNLKSLNSQGIITEKHIKILRIYTRVKTYSIDWLFAMLYKCFNGIFLYNLKGRYPSIFVFDIYKLTYFCNINRCRI